ncbi:putative acetyltransferase [Sphingobium sp. SYK-6]|uniref:GNAT family N-acetyltransferase n=1 Tax=Sphingobium sp. (strain NBRC 103272 / SYK-6) TaxID=627192 RepID=UPI0002277530|nr:GNAT family N-acetyltransferase [Sphingobium sp. SYK-6]BAK67785.1 putative acetyltransferase [Sphingobium sp. SYK-6]
MIDGTKTSLLPLRAQDRGAWTPLWEGYQAFYEVAIAPAVSDVTWARLLDPDEPMSGLLAWEGGNAIGLVHFIWHRSTWTPGDYCYLQDLFVDPAERGGGIGRRLIEAVYAAAAERGCSRVHWLTHETNVDAMLLYDRIAQRSGFVQYRELL